MKLLIAVTSPKSYTLIKGQGRYLVNQGYEVVFVSGKDNSIKELAESEGMKYVELSLKREISIFDDLIGIWKAVKILRTHKPNLVNASTPKSGLIFMIASFFFPRIYPIFTLRGLRSDTLRGIKRIIVTFFEKLTCSLARNIIVISPSLRKHCVDRGIVKLDKSIVLGRGSSNGVEVEKFSLNEHNIAAGKEIRNYFKIPNDGVVFGFIGRIVKDKGIIEIFEAFERMILQKSEVYLIIVGEFEDADPIPDDIVLRMKQQKRVFFIGFQENVAAVLTIFDVLILYSYREGFGNVCIEASSASKPIIVSNIPGAKDTVINNRTGLLVKERNVEALFNAMRYYMENSDIRKKHGIAGRKFVLENFGSEKIWGELSGLYKRLLSG